MAQGMIQFNPEVDVIVNLHYWTNETSCVPDCYFPNCQYWLATDSNGKKIREVARPRDKPKRCPKGMRSKPPNTDFMWPDRFLVGEKCWLQAIGLRSHTAPV